MSSANQHPITDLLFVYGTLMQGFHNPYARQLHQQSRLVGSGHLPGKLYRVCWFPGAVPDPAATSRIYGEVYQLLTPTETLSMLDEYEDVAAGTPGVQPSDCDGSGIYVRRALPVQMADQVLTCWIYTYNASTAKLVPIESGRFDGSVTG